jgi:nucleoside-diphosphate-sugar epimerase
MMERMAGDLHVVMGSSGGLGRAVIRELRRQGKPARAVSRSHDPLLPEGVEPFRVDIRDSVAARSAANGAAVIYFCANVPYPEWTATLPGMLESALGAAASSAARLVYADNLYMYGPTTGPLSEDLPAAATGRKGRLRAELAGRVLEAHRTGRVQAVIARASDFYGPAVTSAMLGPRVFRPAVDGGKVKVIGNLDAPHTYSYIDDVARALVLLGGREEALGEIWHTPNAETLSTGAMLNLIFEEADAIRPIQCASLRMLQLAGLFDPMIRELVEIYYQFDQPFVVDHSKYEQRFGASVTPHREAIRQTLDWFRAHPEAA